VQPDNQTHLSPEQLKQIEEDERELRAIMLDQHGVAASAVAAGTVAVGVGKVPMSFFAAIRERATGVGGSRERAAESPGPRGRREPSPHLW
jgi:hypothetical protein